MWRSQVWPNISHDGVALKSLLLQAQRTFTTSPRISLISAACCSWAMTTSLA